MNTTYALERGKDRVRAMSCEVKQITRDQEPPDRITEPICLLQLGADRADYQEQTPEKSQFPTWTLTKTVEDSGTWAGVI